MGSLLDHAFTVRDALYVGGAWWVLACVQRALMMYLERGQKRANEASAIRQADREILEGVWPTKKRTSRILDIVDDLNKRDRKSHRKDAS